MADDKPQRVSDDPTAPFGHNEDGTPLAPYGFKADGKTPRISNRGRRSDGSSPNPTQRKSETDKLQPDRSKENKQRKAALLAFGEMFITAPLTAASGSKQVAKRIGQKHCDALAADGMIFDHFSSPLADGIILMCEDKPERLAFLDGAADKAGTLLLAKTLIEMTMTIKANHTDPDPAHAQAGRRLFRMKAQQMADAVNEEAQRMGIPSDSELENAAA